eukprot:8997461-Ditylum_brightwellii.AAC.1
MNVSPTILDLGHGTFVAIHPTLVPILDDNSGQRFPATIILQGWDREGVFYCINWEIQPPDESKQEKVVPRRNVRRVVLM